ncbi:MAG: hypothetical protein ACHQ51_08245 [Elusimicrobiota bacterium]
MTDSNPLSIAAALASQLNAAGADYSARAANGTADALLVPKADAAKTVGLVLRQVASDAPADAAAIAVGEKLKSFVAKRTGVLSVLAQKTPKAADAAALAAGIEKALAALDAAAAGADGLKILENPPAGSGFEYASWAPQSESLAIELLFRVPTEHTEVKTDGASAHWLAFVLPDDRRPVVRAVPVKMPAGDVVKRLWWAFPKKGGWTFLPF